MKLFFKGQLVTIHPDYHDGSNETPMWLTIDDEEKGRVSITPLNSGLNIPPVQTVAADMLQTPTAGEFIVHCYVSDFIPYITAEKLIADLAPDYQLELYFAYQLKEGA